MYYHRCTFTALHCTGGLLVVLVVLVLVLVVLVVLVVLPLQWCNTTYVKYSYPVDIGQSWGRVGLTREMSSVATLLLSPALTWLTSTLSATLSASVARAVCMRDREREIGQLLLNPPGKEEAKSSTSFPIHLGGNIRGSSFQVTVQCTICFSINNSGLVNNPVNRTISKQLSKLTS